MKTFKFALMCAAVLAMIACQPTNKPSNDGEEEEEEEVVFNSLISVTDGTDADWANVPEEYLAVANCAENPYWEALKSVKVYADLVYINALVEYDITDFLSLDSVHLHAYFDVDFDAATGGYADQWSDADTDILLEGALYLGGQKMDEYVPSAHMWIGEIGGTGWYWEPVVASGVFYSSQWIGENKLEIKLMRRMITPLWNDEFFKVGFDLQESWESMGVLPNLPLDANGMAQKAEKLTVTIDKTEY
jgi:hypothetical protein